MSLLYHNDTIIKKGKELLRALLIQFCKLEIVYFLSLYAYPKLIGGAVTDTYINSSVPSFNKP